MSDNLNITPIDFIKERVGRLANDFKSVTIKYGYDYLADAHIVELTPESEYYNNKALDDAWIPMSLEFDNTFLNDVIVFVSSDSTLRVEHPELEWNTSNKKEADYKSEKDAPLAPVLPQAKVLVCPEKMTLGAYHPSLRPTAADGFYTSL